MAELTQEDRENYENLRCVLKQQTPPTTLKTPFHEINKELEKALNDTVELRKRLDLVDAYLAIQTLLSPDKSAEVQEIVTLNEKLKRSLWLPNITVSDLIDWLDRYSNIEAPSALDSVYGIDFVTDQADRLFWTIAPIVAHLKTIVPRNPSSQSTLKQIFSNERVTWALDNILSQLNALTNLAA